jgi:short-subunit dehydrogenase
MERLPTSYHPVILVTGCSSGLGMAIAEKIYHLNHFRLVITARPESLHFIKSKFSNSERVLILPLDVTDEKSRTNCVSKVYETWGNIDILVNNAGICYRSVLEDMSEADELLQMKTNYLGPIRLTQMVLPKMREKGRGKIINISSVSGLISMPTMSSYSASKAALEGSTEALWYEVKPFGINLSLVQAGFIKSDSYQRVRYSQGAQLSKTTERPYTQIYQSVEPFIAKLMKRGLATPESIADLVLAVIRTQNPPLWIPASLDSEFFYYIRRISPRRILHPILFWALPNSSQWGNVFSKRRKKMRNIYTLFKQWLIK